MARLLVYRGPFYIIKLSVNGALRISEFMDSTGLGLLSFTVHELISERMKGIERYEINSKATIRLVNRMS